MGIVSDALAYEGKISYQYGGSNIEVGGSGDCSAFTQKIFREYGYEIGRSTIDQVKKGVEVSYNDLQPGDLVFFEGTNPNRAGVSHVGIYVGNGNMVNLQGNGVVVEPIMAEWWKEHYMTARRVAEPEDVGKVSDTVHGGGGGSITGSAADNSGSKEWDLEWWADIVVVVLIILCIAGGLFFIYKAFADQLSKMLPSIDDIGNMVENIKPDGGAE